MDNIEFARELEKRTERFADRVFSLCKKLEINTVDREIISQLVRASGSVGANYIEANESLSRKDFFHRIRICRKESKEARFWLKRLLVLNAQKRKEIEPLINETSEFVLLFSKIVSKA
jgi:four helix bundle protein